METAATINNALLAAPLSIVGFVLSIRSRRGLRRLVLKTMPLR
jgi:hypothetical protein